MGKLPETEVPPDLTRHRDQDFDVQSQIRSRKTQVYVSRNSLLSKIYVDFM